MKADETATIEDVLSDRARWCIQHARYEDFSKSIPDGSVNLLWLDPPYFRVVDEEWDRAWKTEDDFLAWLRGVVSESSRVLAQNGSLYLFASPQMSGRVECLARESFDVLNNLVWVKRNGWHAKADEDAIRGYFTQTERIVFAQQGVFVHEELRQYLAYERDKAGFTTRMVAEQYQKKSGSATVTGMAGHWFERVQWALPTEENYEWLRSLFGNGSLAVSWSDIKASHDRLRRQFDASLGGPTTDVWTYETVAASPQKHPCEKPHAMLRDVMRCSSRPNDVVCEFFGGSFRMAEVALSEGRRYIGCDADKHWADVGVERARATTNGTVALVPSRRSKKPADDRQVSLFGDKK